MPQEKTKIKNTIKKCTKCKKFYDPHNVNFFLNLALSKKIEEQTSVMAVKVLRNNLINHSDLDWCFCYSAEKQKHKKAADEFLYRFEKSYKNHTVADIKNIGFDFFSNKDFLYIKNGSNFDKMRYFNFLKITKNNLDFEDTYSFDFLTYEKMRNDEFLNYYKSFFNYPNYLVIDELEMLNGKENSKTDNKILRNIIAIVKERFSNGKRTYITLGMPVEDFKQLLSNNFWDTEEVLYLELYNILTNSEYFTKMNMTLTEREGVVGVKTAKIRATTNTAKEGLKAAAAKLKDNVEPEFD
jgi:hypothetical protein